MIDAFPGGQVPKSKPPRPSRLHRGRFVAAFVVFAVLLILAQAFHQFIADHILVTAISVLLILSAALFIGPGLLTPPLREVAFYFFAVSAAGLMWPGAHLALAAYEDAGFAALAAFMIFVFALAVALAVLSAYLLSGRDDER